MRSFFGTDWRAAHAAFAVAACASWQPALAQDEPVADEEAVAAEGEAEDEGSRTDIISADTLSVIVDGRLVLADGANSWADGGLGKTRFDGTDDGDFELDAYPVEASLIWQPRISNSFVGNFSAADQHGHDRDENVDVMEGYLTFIPRRRGNTNFALKAGYYWPEISLEHATGGAWSTVYTITPSASAITVVPSGMRMSTALSDCQFPRVWVPAWGVPTICPRAPSG